MSHGVLFAPTFPQHLDFRHCMRARHSFRHCRLQIKVSSPTRREQRQSLHSPSTRPAAAKLGNFTTERLACQSPRMVAYTPADLGSPVAEKSGSHVTLDRRPSHCSSACSRQARDVCTWPLVSPALGRRTTRNQLIIFAGTCAAVFCFG